MKFVGTHTAREVSLCKLDPEAGKMGGANPLAHKLLHKSKTTAAADVDKTNPNPSPENDEMDMNVVKAMLVMDDVTKAYAATLADDVLKAFVTKSAADQKAEAHEAKKKADDTAAAEAAKAAGVTAKELELTKSLQTANSEIEVLRKRLDDGDRDREITKAAAHKDFDGYPGGVDAVIAKMKTVAGQPEEVRKAVEEGMKAQAQLAKALAPRVGTVLSAAELEKSAPATHRVTEAAKSRAKEHGTQVETEMYKMSQEPGWREDFSAMQDEAMAIAE